jgi:aminopeptidase-like protein
MYLLKELDRRDPTEIGQELYRFAVDLYPICRSITGNGIRRTLTMIRDRIALEMSEVPSGTPVFDWTVPKEWNIRDAYIKRPDGKRVVDFRQCNLHVLNYSTPVQATMPLSQLKPHLFTLPEHPDWIPYRTSYYHETWGFCLSHKQMLGLEDGDYEVCIDSSLEDGNLTYGEYYLRGRSTDEVLISCHCCHPSLANDNISGVTVAAFLAQLLSGRDLRYSYRFLFIPGTIGAITWLARNRETAGRIRHGLVLTGVGDAGGFHYKKSRRGNAEIDRAAVHVLRHHSKSAEILEFSPYGYDERQYCSPGFNLPVGCLMRSVWGTFPEYHTSADNLDFIHPLQLAESLSVCAGVVDVLEHNRRYRNLSPYCEPQLGKRNLYRPTGGDAIGLEINARLWVLNLSDSGHYLLDIAERSGIAFSAISDAAELLCQNGLLSVIHDGASGGTHQDGGSRIDVAPSPEGFAGASRQHRSAPAAVGGSPDGEGGVTTKTFVAPSCCKTNIGYGLVRAVRSETPNRRTLS